MTFVHRPGAELYLADTLSCAYLPLSNQAPDYDTTERVCLCEEEMEVEAVNAMSDVYGISDQWLQELVRDTAVDPEMQQLVQLIQSGWPNARCKVPMQVRGQMHDVRYQCRSGPILTFRMNLSLQME